jgi:hypothetical protein
MRDPLLVGQRVEADARGPAPVAVAQDVGGEGRGRDHVEEAFAEFGVAGRGR